MLQQALGLPTKHDVREAVAKAFHGPRFAERGGAVAWREFPWAFEVGES